jgi:hypothetical protein
VSSAPPSNRLSAESRERWCAWLTKLPQSLYTLAEIRGFVARQIGNGGSEGSTEQKVAGPLGVGPSSVLVSIGGAVRCVLYAGSSVTAFTPRGLAPRNKWTRTR